MKKNILLILCFVISAISFGQTWTQHPSTTSAALNGIHFISATNGWAVGQGGVIVATTDGGTTWAGQNSGSSVQLNAVHFISASYGLAVGSGGTILKTINGGMTWSNVSASIPFNLSSVCSSTTTLYVVGDMGGAGYCGTVSSTWNGMATSTPFNLKSISFISNLQGAICGDNGIILKTTNGGANWSTQVSGTTQSLNSIIFISATEGWAAGNTGTILHTTDGGTTWTAQTSGVTTHIGSIFFTDALNGWAASGTKILATTNGGVTWTSSVVTSAFLVELFFVNPTTGWAIGSSGTILKYSASSVTTGLNEFTSKSTVRLFPNPGSTLLNIETEDVLENVSLYNCLGSLVKSETQKTFSVEELPAGVYVVDVKTEKGRSTARFVKESF